MLSAENCPHQPLCLTLDLGPDLDLSLCLYLYPPPRLIRETARYEMPGLSLHLGSQPLQ